MPPIGTSTPIEPPVDGSAEASAEGSAQAPTQGSAATPESGEPIWSLIVRDVTREQEAAEELEQRVNDRELMMRELHHRLKNNIFMVAGYIDIQSTEDLDDRARQTLQTVRGNLESMALAHERLYRESSLSEISFGEYLTDVVHAAAAMRGAGIATRVSVAGSSCPMEMNRALRLGLVVNELVVNAVEHAFPEQRGEVLVALETGESGKTGETTDGKTGRLLIQDDGVGLPAESEGFGMEIVAALVEQVGGTLRFFNNRELATEVGGNAPDTGTSVVIDFACG
jgi:two-component sensor histidine kinase